MEKATYIRRMNGELKLLFWRHCGLDGVIVLTSLSLFMTSIMGGYLNSIYNPYDVPSVVQAVVISAALFFCLLVFRRVFTGIGICTVSGNIYGYTLLRERGRASFPKALRASLVHQHTTYKTTQTEQLDCSSDIFALVLMPLLFTTLLRSHLSADLGNIRYIPVMLLCSGLLSITERYYALKLWIWGLLNISGIVMLILLLDYFKVWFIITGLAVQKFCFHLSFYCCNWLHWAISICVFSFGEGLVLSQLAMSAFVTSLLSMKISGCTVEGAVANHMQIIVFWAPMYIGLFIFVSINLFLKMSLNSMAQYKNPVCCRATRFFETTFCASLLNLSWSFVLFPVLVALWVYRGVICDPAGLAYVSPYIWISNYIMDIRKLTTIFLLFSILLPGIAIIHLLAKQSEGINKSKLLKTRKGFHFLATALFLVPLGLQQVDLLCFAIMGACWIFILLETIRITFPTSHVVAWIDNFTNRFIDNRDTKGIMITHNYLLLGMGIPFIIEYVSCRKGSYDIIRACMGIFTVGIGDSMVIFRIDEAAIAGVSYGKNRMPASRKTTAGFFGFLLSCWAFSSIFATTDRWLPLSTTALISAVYEVIYESSA